MLRRLNSFLAICCQFCIFPFQVLVAKRTAEVRLDKQNFGEKRETNRRKQMIMEGLSPEEVGVLFTSL
jgi:hypothetical protein